MLPHVEGLRVYRSLLANRPLSKLLLGEFISGIGDWLYIVAIFVVIYRESHDAALVGAFGAIRLIPYILLSVPAGIVADRFERRLVLLVSDLFRGSLMIVLTILVATNAPVVLIAAVAILAASGSAFFYPAMGAYMPSLVTDERQLGPANSAWSSLQNVSFIVGPAIGGILIAIGGVTLAFVLNAATFGLIAVILWSLPRQHPRDAAPVAVPPATDEAAAEPPTSVATGSGVAPAVAASAAQDERIPLVPFAGLTVVQLMGGIFGGGIQVLTVVLAVTILHAGEDGNGYLNAAIGVGGLLGALGSGALVLRRALAVPLLIGAVVTALGSVALGVSPGILLAMVSMGILATGLIVLDVVSTTLFQRFVPDKARGRGTGVLMTVSTLSAAAGAFFMPVLVTSVGVLETMAGAGVILVVGTGVGLGLMGSATTRPPTPYEAVLGRVSKLPLFAGVPAGRLETALHRLREHPVAASEVVIRQGEPADRFYIVESGTFAVTQAATSGAAPILLRELGPDSVFGELGLLNRGPRTATVTAKIDGVLLELDGPDFLTLVGANAPLRGRLLGLYGSGGS